MLKEIEKTLSNLPSIYRNNTYYLFGSSVTGEFYNDIDLLIVYDEKDLKYLFALKEYVSRFILKKFHKKADITIMNCREFTKTGFEHNDKFYKLTLNKQVETERL